VETPAGLPAQASTCLRPRASGLRAVWLWCLLGLALTSGLVLPDGASAYSRHFTVQNFSSYELKFKDVTQATSEDTPGLCHCLSDTVAVEGRPPDGAVTEPGSSAGFELTFFAFRPNGARAEFSILDHGKPTGGSLYATMVVYAGGIPPDDKRTDCRVNPPPAVLCIAPGDRSDSIVFVEPPGTVNNLPASLKQQQAEALNTLCVKNSAAACSFTAKKQEHLESPPHQLAGHVDNPGNFDETTRITLEDTVTISNSLEIALTAGVDLFEVVKAEIETRYTRQWGTEHRFSQEVELKVPDHKRCWFVATSPILRYTGDFKVALGNTIWNLTDVYFDGPDTSPGGKNWGYTPKCVDLQAGNAAANVMCGRGGSDVLRGLGGDDTLLGDRCRQRAGLTGLRATAAAASGKDHLFGGWGDDRLFGGPRADRIHGGPGGDLLHAGRGRDLLRSGSGDDVLLVRDGARDHVTCGQGQDVVRADRRDRLAGCERVRLG
jgi:RTX calcium-binding nonapeptide repeat (4 copies)